LNRSEQLVREKADALAEIDSMKAQAADDMAKARFELQEFEVTVETYRAENERLRQEISEMSGDDMRNEREMRNQREDRAAAVAAVKTAAQLPSPPPDRRNSASPPPPGDAPSLHNQRSSRSERRKSTSSDQGNLLARELDISGRHDDLGDLVAELTDMLSSMNISREDKLQLTEWGKSFSSTSEQWFSVAEAKFEAFEKGGVELGRRIKDLESQRTRLEKDLEMRTDKVPLIISHDVYHWRI
jgi:hypothetical protein